MLSAPPGPPTFDECWPALEPEFQRCLALAWESTCAGSLGIGSVIADADGSIVATGRNRLFEHDSGEDHLAGSPVAHAEMNALGKLSSGRDHTDFVLWTSLEPCLLCAGGIRLSGIGSVRFLAADPLWSNVGDVLTEDPFIGSSWPRSQGPRGCEFAAFALLLPFHAVAFWNPRAEAALAWEAHAPALGELAAELAATHELVALAASRAPVDEVISELWSRLNATLD